MTKIEVTADDILFGRPKSCSRCPVALAIARVIRSDAKLTVGVSTVGLDYRGLELPIEAEAAIMGFDQTGHMDPFSFDLDIPQGLLRKND